MKTFKSTNLGLLKRGYNIPHTEVIAYLYPKGMLRAHTYEPRLIYEDKDMYYYHGKNDLQNVISTYLDNRPDIEVNTGDIIGVYITQMCQEDPYVEEVSANFWFTVIK